MPRAVPTRPARRTSAEIATLPSGGGNSLVASAANLTRTEMRPKTAGAASWQRQAWDFYDEVGELRFAGNWMGNAMSRVNITCERMTDDGPEPVEDGPAAEAADALFGGQSGQSQMMGSLGVHLTIAGESYLVGEPQTEGPDDWMVLSTEEISGKKDRWTIDRGDGRRRPLNDDSLIVRIWRPHPRKWVEADSSVRAVLPILRELVQLTKHVAATIDSRLAGAGILLLPSEMTFSARPGMDPQDPLADPFIVALTDAMLAAIEDRANPASVVPTVIRAPAAAIGAAQHLTFSTPLDGQAQSLREEAIRRMALGLDMPPEVLLGQSDSNHWSAWQIDESAIKVHVEPTAELACDALTRQYLWPVIEGNVDGWEDYYLTYDTSDLRTRPNHSSEAIQLYDRLELSGEALRRETGFDESDAPDKATIKDTLLRFFTINGQPEQQVKAAKELGLDLGDPPPTVREATISVPVSDPPPPALESVRAVPEQAASLLAACELMALRALERAHNRLSRRNGDSRPCPHGQIETVLKGAWDHVPRVATMTSTDASALEARLDTYARAVLLTGAQHNPELLLRILQMSDGALAEVVERARG